MAEVATVGVLTFREFHSVAGIAGKSVVLDCCPESLSQHSERALDDRGAGVLASLTELELELGRERRTAARDARRARGQSVGRRKALTDEKAALARRMHDSGESATTIATTLNVSRATVYRALSNLPGVS